MQDICTHPSRTLLRIAVAACGFVALSAVAAQPTSSTNSSRLAVSVTVVYSSGNAQAPVINMSCVNAGGEVKCRPRNGGDTNAATEPAKSTAGMREEMHWY
jgi:hypothetical protein